MVTGDIERPYYKIGDKKTVAINVPNPPRLDKRKIYINRTEGEEE